MFLRTGQHAILDLLPGDDPSIAAGALRAPGGATVPILADDRVGAPAAAADQQAAQQKLASVRAIERIPRFVAVNSAVEVDLFGQVNAERMGGALQAGAGGLPVFAQGALLSPGGRLLICLRATAARGAVSRIVPALDGQGICTLPRNLADAVITEHGVAELRGLGVEQRAQALIRIAAPEHRAALGAAWESVSARL